MNKRSWRNEDAPLSDAPVDADLLMRLLEGSGAIRGIKIRESPLDMLLKQPVRPPIRVEYVH